LKQYIEATAIQSNSIESIFIDCFAKTSGRMSLGVDEGDPHIFRRAHREDWRNNAKAAVKKLWKTEYKSRPLPTAPEQHPEERRVALTSVLNDYLGSLLGAVCAADVEDEYEVYCAQMDNPEDLACTDPFTY
jgi:hypothetical protein